MYRAIGCKVKHFTAHHRRAWPRPLRRGQVSNSGSNERLTTESWPKSPTRPPSRSIRNAKPPPRPRVLAAAGRLFALHGFQNVSVRDITAEGGGEPRQRQLPFRLQGRPAVRDLPPAHRRAEPRAGRGCCTRHPTAHAAGKPPVREILRAFFQAARAGRRRATGGSRSIRPGPQQSTEAMREVRDTASTAAYNWAALLFFARTCRRSTWRLHFVLGMTRNKLAELDRLHVTEGYCEGDASLPDQDAGFRRGRVSGLTTDASFPGGRLRLQILRQLHPDLPALCGDVRGCGPETRSRSSIVLTGLVGHYGSCCRCRPGCSPTGGPGGMCWLEAMLALCFVCWWANPWGFLIGLVLWG